MADVPLLQDVIRKHNATYAGYRRRDDRGAPPNPERLVERRGHYFPVPELSRRLICSQCGAPGPKVRGG